MYFTVLTLKVTQCTLHIVAGIILYDGRQVGVRKYSHGELYRLCVQTEACVHFHIIHIQINIKQLFKTIAHTYTDTPTHR